MQEKSIDLLIQEFEDGLIKYINSSNAPIKAKACILGNIHQIISQAAVSKIAKERSEMQIGAGREPKE